MNNLVQDKKINLLFAVVSIIAGGATIWWITQQNKHSKLEAELFKLDKEIKEIQLGKLKNVK
jgi:hypothetical protein